MAEPMPSGRGDRDDGRQTHGDQEHPSQRDARDALDKQPPAEAEQA
jgi:hypothetical protein